MLYLGIGAGRLAVPLYRAGVELIGVDAHPDMLSHLRRRAPRMETHQAVVEELHLRRKFDLVIAPSSILSSNVNLAAAVRHVRPGGRIGMELMNPHWLANTKHKGVRLKQGAMEVDYRLPDGSVVVQVVNDWRPGPAPEDARRRLARFDVELLWLGPRPDLAQARSPTYFVLGGRR